MIKLISVIMIFFGITGSELNNELQSYLQSKLASYESFEFEIVKMPRNADKVKIDYDKDFKISGSIGYVPIYIYKNSQNPSASYLTVKLKLMKNVLVMKEDINSNTELTSNMFEQKLMDVSKLRGTLFTKWDQIPNYKNSIKLYAGSILVQENMTKIPDVTSGNSLNAFSNAGSVSISTKAFAREDGNIGENIKIRTIDNKMFLAKIIDIKKVIILE